MIRNLFFLGGAFTIFLVTAPDNFNTHQLALLGACFGVAARLLEMATRKDPNG